MPKELNDPHTFILTFGNNRVFASEIALWNTNYVILRSGVPIEINAQTCERLTELFSKVHKVEWMCDVIIPQNVPANPPQQSGGDEHLPTAESKEDGGSSNTEQPVSNVP